jgi:uncharacterized protein (DUF849 family)
MWLQACLNGSRTSTEHSAVPLTPAALADDARRVLAAGDLATDNGALVRTAKALTSCRVA